MYNVLANAIVLAHFLYSLRLLSAAVLLVIRWPRLAVVHLPAAIWGAVVEIFGWVCPLTPLKNHFRLLAGNSSYSGNFIAWYLIPLIYPENMTITKQYIFGGIVIVINIIFYSITIQKLQFRRHR